MFEPKNNIPQIVHEAISDLILSLNLPQDTQPLVYDAIVTIYLMGKTDAIEEEFKRLSKSFKMKKDNN